MPWCAAAPPSEPVRHGGGRAAPHLPAVQLHKHLHLNLRPHLAVEALGTDRVTGVAMPGPFSSDHSVEDAYALAHNLGIEIREPLVLEATRLAAETRARNLCFLAGSANALLAPAIDALGAANHPLASASIQFPDPWPKARHAKRRVTTAPLVAALAERLPSGGTVLLQSDLQWLAEEMRAAFAAHPNFSCDGRWLSEEERPFPIATERERQAARRGIAVHRSRIVRR